MTTLTQARNAETFAMQQRGRHARSLCMDLTKEVTQAEKDLAAKVIAAAFTGEKFDKALANPAVNKLFARGVLRFGSTNSLEVT